MGLKIDIDEVYAAKKAIEDERDRIHVEIEALRVREDRVNSEINDYAVAIRTFEQISARSSIVQSEPNQDDADEDGGLPRGKLREFIETTLNTFGREGTTVGEMRDYMRHRYNLEVQPNTISVTLNRLKAKGLARLAGQSWSPGEGNLSEAPDKTEWLKEWSSRSSAPSADPDDDIPF